MTIRIIVIKLVVFGKKVFNQGHSKSMNGFVLRVYQPNICLHYVDLIMYFTVYVYNCKKKRHIVHVMLYNNTHIHSRATIHCIVYSV